MNWIKVEDKLPEESGVYPALSMMVGRDDALRLKSGDLDRWDEILYYFDKKDSVWQHSSGLYDHGITHYLPMPEPPSTD